MSIKGKEVQLIGYFDNQEEEIKRAVEASYMAAFNDELKVLMKEYKLKRLLPIAENSVIEIDKDGDILVRGFQYKTTGEKIKIELSGLDYTMQEKY